MLAQQDVLIGKVVPADDGVMGGVNAGRAATAPACQPPVADGVRARVRRGDAESG